jgi:hypothetical protein
MQKPNNNESIRKITKIISTNTMQKDSQRINTIVSLIEIQSDKFYRYFSRQHKK